MTERQFVHAALIPLSVCSFLAAGENSTPVTVQTASGTASFFAPTNVPGIEVKGASSALTAQAEVSRTKDSLLIQKIDARVAVGTLETGMKVRDEHMRKFIFTTADGATPDIRFTADESGCAPALQKYSCQVTGQLSIRGVARPFSLNLRVREQAGNVFRAEGDGLVKLKEYGIDPPSQLGVKPVSDIRFHVDFTAKPQLTAGGK